jgi:DNA polymerase III delta prime subunit
MDKTPLILTGPPGCGKSYWIQKYAEKINKQLFVCPCRKDRTLREGRQKLHIWARRTEPAILWLEGADDLTPEAQAFLRRILETHSSNVLFILECRDAGRLQEPVRSRCLIKKMNKPTWNELEDFIFKNYGSTFSNNTIKIQEIKDYLLLNEYSYRRVKHCINLQLNYPEVWINTYKHRVEENKQILNQDHNQLIHYIKKAYNPDIFIKHYLSSPNILKDYGKCNELAGSLWAFLGSALHKCETTTKNY